MPCSPAPSTMDGCSCTATCAVSGTCCGWTDRCGTPTAVGTVSVRAEGVRARWRAVRHVRQEARHDAHDRPAGDDVLPELPALRDAHGTTCTGSIVRPVVVLPQQ